MGSTNEKYTFFNWSAKESRPFFAALIIGEKSVEGVPLEDEMYRRIREIQKIKCHLLEKDGMNMTHKLGQN
jgi:hypothetical protein